MHQLLSIKDKIQMNCISQVGPIMADVCFRVIVRLVVCTPVLKHSSFPRREVHTLTDCTHYRRKMHQFAYTHSHTHSYTQAHGNGTFHAVHRRRPIYADGWYLQLAPLSFRHYWISAPERTPHNGHIA